MEAKSKEEIALLNEEFIGKVTSRDNTLVKQAEDAVDAFTRTKMREDGIYRRVIPMLPITNDQLDRAVDTEDPVKIVDKEPDSPAAISIGFRGLPDNLYITGDRYKITFGRILTPKWTKDVDQLRTWRMDIRQVLSDNSIKDMLAEEDGQFLRAVNTAIVGPGDVVPTSGVVQYQQISGGITRDTLADMLKIVPGTPSNLETHTCLTNQITIKDVMKFGRNEAGGDVSQDILLNGWSRSTFLGVEWIISIKKALIPTGTIYNFADPKFIGHSYALEDTTMYIRREAYMLEFFAYEFIGGAIGHTSGLGRADFV